jgi:hypothetical protein
MIGAVVTVGLVTLSSSTTAAGEESSSTPPAVLGQTSTCMSNVVALSFVISSMISYQSSADAWLSRSLYDDGVTIVTPGSAKVPSHAPLKSVGPL